MHVASLYTCVNFTCLVYVCDSHLCALLTKYVVAYADRPTSNAPLSDPYNIIAMSN